MAEEQRSIIPLNADLELTTDDMVVPVSKPTFHFNDQVFEAGIMANSFKYEGRGHIGGHFRYEFEDALEGHAETNWPDGRISRLGDVWAIVDPVGTVASFIWNTFSDVIRGTLTSWERADNTDYIRVRGTTERGTPFDIQIDAYTLEVLNGTIANFVIQVERISESAMLISLRKQTDANDLLKYRPAILVASEYNLMLNGITSVGTETTFLLKGGGAEGIIVLSGDAYNAFSIPGLTYVSNTVDGENVIIRAKSDEISDIKIKWGDVRQRVWKVEPKPTIDVEQIEGDVYSIDDPYGALNKQLQSEVIQGDYGEAPLVVTFERYRVPVQPAPPDPVPDPWPPDNQLVDAYIDISDETATAQAGELYPTVVITPVGPNEHQLNEPYHAITPPSHVGTPAINPMGTGSIDWGRYEFRVEGTAPHGKSYSTTMYSTLRVSCDDSVSGRISNPQFTVIFDGGNPYTPIFNNTTGKINVITPVQNNDYTTPLVYDADGNVDMTVTSHDSLGDSTWRIIGTYSAGVASVSITKVSGLGIYPPSVSGSTVTVYKMMPQNNDAGVPTIIKIDDTHFTIDDYTISDSAWRTPSTAWHFTADVSSTFSNDAAVTSLVELSYQYSPNDGSLLIYRMRAPISGAGTIRVTRIIVPFRVGVTVRCDCSSLIREAWTVEAPYDPSRPWFFKNADELPYMLEAQGVDTDTSGYYWFVMSETWGEVPDRMINLQYMRYYMVPEIVTITAVPFETIVRKFGSWNIQDYSVTPITDVDRPPAERYQQDFQFTIAEASNARSVVVKCHVTNLSLPDTSAISMTFVPDTWDIEVISMTLSDLETTPVMLVLKVRDNTLHDITLRNHDIFGSGAGAGASITNMTSVNRVQTVTGAAAGLGTFRLIGSGINYRLEIEEWLLANETRENSYIVFHLSKQDVFEATIGFKGMIGRRDDGMAYVTGNQGVRYEFTYESVLYYIEAEPGARLRLLGHVTDVLKDRGESLLDFVDREEAFTLSESVMFNKQPMEGEHITEDADDNFHKYWAINKTTSLEITALFVRLLKHNFDDDTTEIVQTRFFHDVFKVSPTQTVIRTGVSCSLSGLPRIWCIVLDNNTDSVFHIKHAAVRVDDIDYTTPDLWTDITVNMVKGGAPSTSDFTYYTTAMSARQVVFSSVISSTVVGGTFIIGFKYQRGIHQWTIKGTQVITGFGSVGPDGLITGNWLPARCCDVTGFNVAPIEDSPDLFGDSCYNVHGYILFCYKKVLGYVYGIDGAGNLLKQDTLSSTLYADEEWDSYTVQDSPVILTAELPIGDAIKQILEALLNTPAKIIYQLIFGRFPKLIRPKEPKGIKLPDSLFKWANIELPGGIGRFTGLWAYLGYWHYGATWLTGPRTGEVIWNPYRQEIVEVSLKPNPLYDMLMLLAGMRLGPDSEAGSALTNQMSMKVSIPGTPGTEGTAGTAARMTQDQADQIKAKLGTGKAGSHSDANIAQYAADAGVTDPSIISAIQQGSWNADGSNKTWRQGIDSLVDNGTAGTPGTPGSPAVEIGGGQPSNISEQASNIAATPAATAAKVKNVVSMLGNSTDMKSGSMKMSMTFAAELHATDDIVPCCYDGQSIYSGPGYFSIQIDRVNRRIMTYQGGYTDVCKGAILNLLGFTSGLSFSFLGTGITIPEIPKTLPVDYGTTTRIKNKIEDMQWLGGQHVYINGPLASNNSITFKETSIGFDKHIEQDDWEPAEDFYDEVEWEWRVDKPDVTVSAKGGVIVGNSCGIDKDGFVRTSAPVFSTPMMHDALLVASHNLYCTYVGDDVIHLTIDDTKIIDGTFTNIVKDNDVLVVASMYNVVRAKKGISAQDLRPYSLLQGLRLNKTIGNWIQGLQILHAFDGYGSRVRSWQGISGGDIEELIQLIQYLPFKEPLPLHSMFPASGIFGKFCNVPVIEYRHAINITTKDTRALLIGTDMDSSVYRISIPVFFKRVADYPAGIQTVAPYKLYVVDGITSLTTDSRTGYARNLKNTTDVMIYGSVYRAFTEYLSQANQTYGMLALRDIALKLGQEVLGADTRSILLFSKITRQLYKFTGAETLDKAQTVWRVKNIERAVYEFLRQELIADAEMQLPQRPRTLIRFDQLVPKGTIPIPAHIESIDKYGSQAGYVWQGQQRVQIPFGIYREEMHTLNLDNQANKWKRIKGDDIADFFTEREYNLSQLPDGYYWEPFRLATAFLGLNDSTDCQFEWVVTFAFTEWMHRIVGDKFVTVHLASETACPNGHRKSEVTHVRLRNDMFQRSNERIGYYTFRFNGRNGAGNSERLFIWCDGIMALRNLELVVRPVTTARTSPLLTAADFSAVDEF